MFGLMRSAPCAAGSVPAVGSSHQQQRAGYLACRMHAMAPLHSHPAPLLLAPHRVCGALLLGPALLHARSGEHPSRRREESVDGSGSPAPHLPRHAALLHCHAANRWALRLAGVPGFTKGHARQQEGSSATWSRCRGRLTLIACHGLQRDGGACMPASCQPGPGSGPGSWFSGQVTKRCAEPAAWGASKACSTLNELLRSFTQTGTMNEH